MTSTYRSDGVSAQNVVEAYRTGPGASINNTFERLRVECNELRNSFSLVINQADMRLLLESHLLHNYSPNETRDHLETCLNDIDLRKVKIFELKEHIRTNDYLRPDKNRDPDFLSNLNQYSYSKITTNVTMYFDKGELLPAKSIGDLLALPNITGPFCYKFFNQNKVSFVMLDRKTEAPLYFEASVDKEYSTQEYQQGMLSHINSLSVDSIPSYEYKTEPGISACIESRKRTLGFKSRI
jgi:hypothetical protein